MGPWGASYIESVLLFPQSRDNIEIVLMATMGTTRLSHKGLAWYSSTTRWSPRVARTQP
jgi:hypothetical protein